MVDFFFWEYHPLWVMMPCHITAQRPTASQPCWDLHLFLSAPSFLLLHLGTTANSCPQLGEVQDTYMPLSLIPKLQSRKIRIRSFLMDNRFVHQGAKIPMLETCPASPYLERRSGTTRPPPPERSCCLRWNGAPMPSTGPEPTGGPTGLGDALRGRLRGVNGPTDQWDPKQSKTLSC